MVADTIQSMCTDMFSAQFYYIAAVAAAAAAAVVYYSKNVPNAIVPIECVYIRVECLSRSTQLLCFPLAFLQFIELLISSKFSFFHFDLKNISFSYINVKTFTQTCEEEIQIMRHSNVYMPTSTQMCVCVCASVCVCGFCDKIHCLYYYYCYCIQCFSCFVTIISVNLTSNRIHTNIHFIFDEFIH